jgi:hypothetical protein
MNSTIDITSVNYTLINIVLQDAEAKFCYWVLIYLINLFSFYGKSEQLESEGPGALEFGLVSLQKANQRLCCIAVAWHEGVVQ